MTVQKRKDLLLKVDNDGAGSFATVAAMRSEGGAAGFVDIVARLLAATFTAKRRLRNSIDASRAVPLGRDDGDAAWDVTFFPASLLVDDAVRTRGSFARRSR